MYTRAHTRRQVLSNSGQKPRLHWIARGSAGSLLVNLPDHKWSVPLSLIIPKILNSKVNTLIYTLMNLILIRDYRTWFVSLTPPKHKRNPTTQAGE